MPAALVAGKLKTGGGGAFIYVCAVARAAQPHAKAEVGWKNTAIAQRQCSKVAKYLGFPRFTRGR